MARERTGKVFEREKGIWYARVSLTDPSGKRRQIWRKGENKSHAKELLKELLGKIDESDGTFIEGEKLMLNEYLDRWLDAAARPRLAERTFIDYKDLLTRYVRHEIGNTKLAKVNALMIQKLYSDMQARGLSPRVVRYTHAVLSSALKQAVKWGLLMRNPASLVELPKQTRKEMQALSPDDAAKFLEAAKDDRWGIVFALALMTGMRPEEYLGLQWKDIDFDQGIVTIQRTLVWRRKGGGWYFGEPKTNRSRRNIPIPFSLVSALRDHKRYQAEQRMKAGPNYHALELVFATPDGGPLMPQNLYRRHFKPILKRAGLSPTIRMYDLRHSCATLLLAADINPKVVSERLGHSTVTLTLDVYSHVLPSMQKEATDRLESLLTASRKNGTQ